MSTIGLFGAFDRSNFGDWLMAYCAERMLRGPYRPLWLYGFETLGLGMDFSCGNFVSLQRYLSQTDTPMVLHTGGETLACSWSAASWMSGQTESAPERPLFYVLPENAYGRRIRRAFFGVGGQDVSALDRTHLAYLIQAMKSAVWISVRDSTTLRNCRELGLEPHMNPDIVSVMPLLYSPNEVNAHGEYVVLQLNHTLIERFKRPVYELVQNLLNQYKKVVLVAAGVAPGHDSFVDYLSLKRELTFAPEASLDVALEIDPLKLVDLIASARLVIASSLHARIVAMAYGVPRVTVAIKKSVRYATEWDLAPFAAENVKDVLQTASLSESESGALMRSHGNWLARETFEAWRKMTRQFLDV